VTSRVTDPAASTPGRVSNRRVRHLTGWLRQSYRSDNYRRNTAGKAPWGSSKTWEIMVDPEVDLPSYHVAPPSVLCCQG